MILLLNLLIAMMGDTYAKIAEIKNEWMRQVAITNMLIIIVLLVVFMLFFAALAALYLTLDTDSLTATLEF